VFDFHTADRPHLRLAEVACLRHTSREERQNVSLELTLRDVDDRCRLGVLFLLLLDASDLKRVAGRLGAQLDLGVDPHVELLEFFGAGSGDKVE